MYQMQMIIRIKHNLVKMIDGIYNTININVNINQSTFKLNGFHHVAYDYEVEAWLMHMQIA